ncbi:MAG: adenylate/guanylate cyclase domain-containing protein [Spirochaetia bacterium]|nr:adenylate/guanylate cyclase domain-containing protein [Spirochaetia bacterium]
MSPVQSKRILDSALMKLGSRSTLRGFFCILLFGQALSCGQRVSTGNLPIDLSKERWSACRSFEPSFIHGLPDNKESCIRVARFPILLDRLLPVPTGSGTHDWTVSVRFSIPEAGKKNLVLFLPVIGENWEVFLNGESLRREIFTDANGEISKHRSMKGVTIDLPPGSIVAGENLIVFHIRGVASAVKLYLNDYTGFYMRSGYEIDSVDNLYSKRSELLSFMLYSVYFFFGVYHLILYFSNRQQRYNLSFAMLSVFLFFYCILISNSVFQIIPDLDSSYLKKAEFVSLFCMMPSIKYFLVDYFEPGGFRKITRSSLVWNGTLAVLAAALPFTYAKVVLPIWQIAALAQLPFLVYLMARFVRQRNSDAYVMGSTFLLVVFAAVFDIVAALTVTTDIRVFQATFFLFIISIVGTIALRLRRLERSERQLNEELRGLSVAFYRFVPTQVLEQMEKKSAADLKVGDNALRLMNVLFSDIRGFTAMSENMSPDDNFRFLNSYLTRMEPLIASEGGYVDKFLGDGIMALFSQAAGAVDGKTPSERGLDAAIAMRRDLPEYNTRRKQSGYPAIDIGIGLHTGPLIIGAVGSSNRIDTTVIGNTVNVASRIEGMTTYYKAGIIISEALRTDLTQPENYRIREIGSILVKGKQQPIVLYEVYDTDPQEIAELKETSSPFISGGISLFRDKHFEEARKLFREALLIYKADSVARVYYKLSEKFMNTDVPENWKGAIEVFRK